MNKSLYDHAYGVREFVPTRVEYTISEDEFCELSAKYLKERLNISVNFTMDDLFDDRGELSFSNVKSLKPNATHHDHGEAIEVLADLGLIDSAPYSNFEVMSTLLFGVSDEVNIKKLDDVFDYGRIMLTILVPYADFVAFNGPEATKISEFAD